MNTENQRQHKVKIGVKEKYNAFLNIFYKKIENDEFINMNLLLSTYKVGRQVSPILQSEKIIKKIAHQKYIWIGKKPSSQMVDLIIEKSRFYSFERSQETKQTEIDFKTSVTKPIKKPAIEKYSVTKIKELKEQKQNYSFSLFWGLVKINKS